MWRVLSGEVSARGRSRNPGRCDAQGTGQRMIVPMNDKIRQVFRRTAGVAANPQNIRCDLRSLLGQETAEHLLQSRAHLLVLRATDDSLGLPAFQV